MTAADLKRLNELRKETNKLRSRLESLRNASPVSATNYSGTGTGSGTGDPVAEVACSAVDVDRKIKDNLKEMQVIIDTVKTDNIGIVRDIDRLHKLLELYYVEGKSYEKLYREMFYADPSGPQKYMDAFRSKLCGISAKNLLFLYHAEL